MRKLFTFFFFTIIFVSITHAKTYFWSHNLTFDAEKNGRVMYNSRDRLEMTWHDMTFIIQIYSNQGINDNLLKRNLQRRASSYNMYDTRTNKHNHNSFKGFVLTGTLPDGSKAEIYNIVSKKSKLCLQVIINYTSASEKEAKKIIKSLKQKSNKKCHKKKQKIGKKNTPPKNIKKSAVSPTELYEI